MAKAQLSFVLIAVLLIAIVILATLTFIPKSQPIIGSVKCDGLKAFLETRVDEAFNKCLLLLGQGGGVVDPVAGETFGAHKIAYAYDNGPMVVGIQGMEAETASCATQLTKACLEQDKDVFRNLGCGIQGTQLETTVAITAKDVAWRVKSRLGSRSQDIDRLGPGEAPVRLRGVHDLLQLVVSAREQQERSSDVPLTTLRSGSFNVTVIQSISGTQIYEMEDPRSSEVGKRFVFQSAHRFS